MINDADDNLPPQLSTDPNFLNEKEVDCEACEGTGKDFMSCCGDDMRGNDYDLCPSCHEHTGWSGSIKDCEFCMECGGSGKQITN